MIKIMQIISYWCYHFFFVNCYSNNGITGSSDRSQLAWVVGTKTNITTNPLLFLIKLKAF